MVKACLDWLTKAGAEVVVGDNPGVVGYGMNEHAARVTGIAEAAGPHYRNISRDVVEIEFDPSPSGRVVVSRAVREADLFISLPRFKTHMQTLLSAAVKNSYGILAGGEKALFHRLAPTVDDFSRLVAQVYAIRPPDLVIMDAIEVMEGNGPSSRDLRRWGKVLASTDGVALDSLAAAVMGLESREIPMLRAAAELKLGQTSLDRIDIEGRWAPLPRFKRPLPFARRGVAARLANRLWGSLFWRARPWIDRRACARCQACLRQCPVGAVIKRDEEIKIDPLRCIHCYCCYEICSYEAVRVGGRFDRMLKAAVRIREGI
jgi:uncharacterized protein (DUF362 family)/Pyruvate/2-oxoacid:ferredoxin oxidoreductase delta subunit